MSDTPRGPGWWMADDGRWYAAEERTDNSTRPPERPSDLLEPGGAPTDPDVPKVVVPADPADPPPPDVRPVGGRRTPVLVVAAVVAVVALAAGAAGAALLLGGEDDDEVAATRSPTTTTESTTVTTEPVVGSDEPEPSPARRPTGVAPPPAGADNRDPALLPSGLFCRDLAADGYSYAAAIEYWRVEGMPDRMDADRNGIPCETVHPTATEVWLREF